MRHRIPFALAGATLLTLVVACDDTRAPAVPPPPAAPSEPESRVESLDSETCTDRDTTIVDVTSAEASLLAGVLELIVFDATAWSATWPVTVLIGTVAIAGGYVQWFVIGRALAARMLGHLPPRRVLHLALRAGVVCVFLGLFAVGLELVRAQEQADLFFDRAMTVRQGMSNHEVRSILGEPNQVFDHTDTSGSPRVCSPGAVREASYWYEHHSLPPRFARDSFVLVVCSDAHGRVVDVRTLRVH